MKPAQTPERQPTVWMNITSSARWTRPPVGIVRVERALAKELAALLGPDRFKLCVWRDERFVEWVDEPAPREAAALGAAVDVILPRTASFDIARPFVMRALQRFAIGQGDTATGDALRLQIPAQGAPALQPARGDVLISAGLDWDYPYTDRFHALAREHGLRIVTCCYDLIPVLFPQYCVGEVAQRFTEYFLQLCWGSEAVLCISKQTENDFRQLCRELGAPERQTVVIPLGDSVPGAGGEIGDQVRAICRKPYILFVSTIERRKNHEVLYRAYHRLARQGKGRQLPQLVFVGMAGWGTGDLLKDIEIDPLTQGLITQLNHATDSELNHLYQHAAFCVYPSLYEGWGLPVGEALAMGKAVIASNVGSLPEVGGALVRYVAPWDVAGWADAIWEWVETPQKVMQAERAVRKGYRAREWAQTARVVADLIDSLPPSPTAQRFTLSAGYDMSTMAGMHAGPSVQATGLAGPLLFGPHWPLRAGSYTVRLTGGRKSAVDETIVVEVASGAGKVLHQRHSTTLTQPIVSGLLADFGFTLGRDVDDFEIRCLVEAGSTLRADAVEVARVAPAVPVSTGQTAAQRR